MFLETDCNIFGVPLHCNAQTKPFLDLCTTLYVKFRESRSQRRLSYIDVRRIFKGRRGRVVAPYQRVVRTVCAASLHERDRRIGTRAVQPDAEKHERARHTETRASLVRAFAWSSKTAWVPERGIRSAARPRALVRASLPP